MEGSVVSRAPRNCWRADLSWKDFLFLSVLLQWFQQLAVLMPICRKLALSMLCPHTAHAFRQQQNAKLGMCCDRGMWHSLYWHCVKNFFKSTLNLCSLIFFLIKMTDSSHLSRLWDNCFQQVAYQICCVLVLVCLGLSSFKLFFFFPFKEFGVCFHFPRLFCVVKSLWCELEYSFWIPTAIENKKSNWKAITIIH